MTEYQVRQEDVAQTWASGHKDIKPKDRHRWLAILEDHRKAGDLPRAACFIRAWDVTFGWREHRP